MGKSTSRASSKRKDTLNRKEESPCWLETDKGPQRTKLAPQKKSPPKGGKKGGVVGLCKDCEGGNKKKNHTSWRKGKKRPSQSRSWFKKKWRVTEWGKEAEEGSLIGENFQPAKGHSERENQKNRRRKKRHTGATEQTSILLRGREKKSLTG